jgi:tRNA threonylcarbamoyl adenosine modification protein YeaZ
VTVLVISTASPALSLALFDDDAVFAHDHRVIGRGHAEALMPAIAAILGNRPPPEAVLVDVGPGSFTGIRIGIAAARALGLAWGVPVTGFCGAALVAARAFAERPGLSTVRVLLDGGRGQLLVSDWTADFGSGETQTLTAEAVPRELPLAGAGVTMLIGDADIVHDGHPDTAFAGSLPLALRTRPPVAHYIRPPDAILPLG